MSKDVVSRLESILKSDNSMILTDFKTNDIETQFLELIGTLYISIPRNDEKRADTEFFYKEFAFKVSSLYFPIESLVPVTNLSTYPCEQSNNDNIFSYSIINRRTITLSISGKRSENCLIQRLMVLSSASVMVDKLLCLSPTYATALATHSID